MFKSFGYFHQSHVRGFFASLVMIVLAAFIGQSYQFFDVDTDIQFMAKADSILKVKANTTFPQSKYKQTQYEDQSFTPNTVRFKQLTELGFLEKDAAMFLAYRKKNQKFENATDVFKIYYIDKEKLSALLMASNWDIPEQIPTVFYNQTQTAAKETKPKTVLMVELNTADSLTLIKLPSIGGYRAMKIIQLRKRLGGFVQLSQLKEIKYFNDTLINAIEPFVSIDSSLIKRININSDDSLMNKHPYFWNGVAKNIINYRKQNGAFQTINDLKKLYTLNEEKINKIKPYIKFQ